MKKSLLIKLTIISSLIFACKNSDYPIRHKKRNTNDNKAILHNSENQEYLDSIKESKKKNKF